MDTILGSWCGFFIGAMIGVAVIGYIALTALASVDFNAEVIASGVELCNNEGTDFSYMRLVGNNMVDIKCVNGYEIRYVIGGNSYLLGDK